MEPNNLFEVDLRNVACIISFVAYNKVSYVGKSIHNHHNCILPSLSPRESHNKIHTYIILRPYRYGQWGVLGLVELTFSFVAHGTN